jgi:phage protein D
MTQRARTAPGVRVVFLPDERASSGEPLDLRDRIVSFTFEDSVEKTDKASLILDNFDLSLFERAALRAGAVLEVSWGYPGNMAPPRRVVVKSLKGFQSLTLEGLAASALMNQHAKTRAWESQKRSDVVREVAREHGYDGEFAAITDSAEVLDTINQAAETDARLLRRLALREGFEFFVDDSGLHWGPRQAQQAPVRVFTWYADPGQGDVMSINVESDLVARVGRCEVRGRDPKTRADVEASATSAQVDRPTLGTVVEVVDPRTGTTSLEQRNATASVRPAASGTATGAEREAAARFTRAEQDAVKLSMQVVGDPTLRAKTVIELRGVPAFLAGKYYVTQAKHTLSGSGYVVALELTRDAPGERRSSEPAQAQGGTPNRAEPAQPGALTSVEVVDARTGSTHVEFRNPGRNVTSNDPEAQRGDS